MKLILGSFVILFLSFQLTCYAQSESKTLSEDQQKYFESIYRDTWSYLNDYVEPLTGLPYDSSARQPPTSLSNVGYYLTAVSIASKTSLLTREEALRKVQKCIESVDQIEKWRGIPRPWVIVRNLKPTYGDEFSYGPHLANLIGGLIVAKSTFPELIDLVNRVITPMKIKDLYEKKNDWLKGGYDAKQQNFAIYQPWGTWYYKYFASETRLLSFYGIARGLFPREHWYALIRPTIQNKDGETFFITGYEEGGIATSFAASIFLDERKSEIGKSQKNYIQYQMKHAKRISAPVWGWSISESPRGNFLTHGELRNDIVAPYASMLAAIYFPDEAYKNLRKLEAFGARPPSEGYGFRDSVNWENGQTAEHYLTVNQGMGFLALANLLYDGIVWKSFGEDPTVKKGIELLNFSDEPDIKLENKMFTTEQQKKSF